MEILLDGELKKQVGKIVVNGDERCIQPSSYDLRAGDEVFLPERGEKKEFKKGGIIHLQPFESALIRTIEEIKLPKNMMGLMQPSSKLSTRGLLYTGGSIDPGYEGFLWVSIRNMAPRYEEIEYGQAVTSVHFIRFKEGKNVVKGYAEEHGKVDDLSRDRRPQKPERTLYDWIKMSSKLDEVGVEVSTIKNAIDHIDNVLYGILYATVAGIMAGLVIALSHFFFGW